MGRKLVPYRRVSTDKQGQSGLGLEHQKTLVDAYAERTKSTTIGDFIEVETGKRSDRPELARAIAFARRHKATLIIAKLDRLARNARFLLALIESGVDVVFCDLPQVPPGAMGKFLLTQMAAVAELEAGLTGERTKAALQAYKEGRHVSKRIRLLYPDGVPPDVVKATAGKLGASLPQCRNLTDEARKRGGARSAAARRAAADTAVADLVPEIIKMWTNDRLSMRVIAERLSAAERSEAGESAEESSVTPPSWSAMRVKRVLNSAGIVTGRPRDHRP